ncbi:MAG: DnaD domain protein [Erysipelotrichaceae bacterium]
MMLQQQDKLHIECERCLINQDYNVLTMLYLPLIEKDAYLLYQILESIASGNKRINNHLLIKNLTGLSMELIERNRITLERYLLVKTFYDPIKNQYIYRLNAPLAGDEFLRHEVFGRLYFKAVGKQMFEYAKQNFANNDANREGYQDISDSMNQILKDVWKEEDETTYDHLKPTKVDENETYAKYFNQMRFLNGLSELVFPSKLRSIHNLKEIAKISFQYGISEKKMQTIVAQSVDLSNVTLDLKKVARKALKEHSDLDFAYENNPYEMHPTQFLKNLQNGIEVNSVDKNLIALLLDRYQLQPDVVNVLLEYVLKQLNQKLSKAYVEKVASSWVRLKIDTASQALSHIKEQEQKPMKQYTNKKAVLPQWYQESGTNKNTSNEVFDDETLKANLKRMGGK